MKTLPRRRKLAVLTLSLVLALAGSALAQKIQVVTSVPDLADITRQVGKDRVAVTSLTLGVRDMHSVQVKPSMASLLSRADVLAVMGLDLEYSFLPAVLDVAANPRISPGGVGYIDTSAGVAPLGVPETLSRTGGDVHPMGNPHYNLDPVLGKRMAENGRGGPVQGLSRSTGVLHEQPRRVSGGAGPAHTAVAGNRPRSRRYPVRQLPRDPGLLRQAVRHAAVRHPWRRRGGIGPTPAHIVRLVKRMKEAGVPLVVYGTYPSRVPKRVAEETGARLVHVPVYVGGRPGVDSYVKLIDYLVTRLSRAVAGT